MLRWPLRRIACGLFALIDHLNWQLIQVLPGTQLIILARRRPWRVLAAPLPAAAQRRWRKRIIWVLQRRCRRAGLGSSCLSRCLSGRLVLDLIGCANQLHLGMSSVSNGDKVPHAWLSDPISGQLLTPGLQDCTGVAPTQL